MNSAYRGLQHPVDRCRPRFSKRNALRTGDLLYLDSSALVKMVIDETESAAPLGYLAAAPAIVSCALARVEVVRAVKLHPDIPISEVEVLLERTNLIEVTEELLIAAAQLASPSLRSLDAIHLAAALSLRAELAALITYDRRLASAAAGMGLRVVAPGGGRI